MAYSSKIALCIALLLLIACHRDPIHYHTLVPPQSTGGAPSNSLPILIEGISVPPQVDRAQIVIRQGNSGLLILETEWWGASLVDELKSALMDHLSASNLKHQPSLRVDVRRFDSIPGHYARIDVAWRLRFLDDEGHTLSTSCRSILQTASGATIDDLVAAHQNNVKRLAAAIVQEINHPREGCPNSA